MFVCCVVLVGAVGAYAYVSALNTDANMVITPRMDTTGIQLNETAYRLRSGETLSFTFEFSTNRTGTASFVINYTISVDIHYTGICDSYLKENTYLDDVRRGYTYHSFLTNQVEGLVGHYTAGGGRSWSNNTSYILSGGDHVLKHVILFMIEGEAEGYVDINFLSEVVLTVVESELPFLTPQQLLAISAATGGAATAAIIGAALFIKKRRSKTDLHRESIESKRPRFLLDIKQERKLFAFT